MLCQTLRSRLLRVDGCAVCDASLKAARVVSTVRPLKLGYKMVGVARTVSIRGDFLTVLQAIRDAKVGEVLMIDAGLHENDQWPNTGGMFGELLAAEAQRKELAGLVIDGNVRDTAAQRTLSIPIFSRGTHPNAGTATTLYQTQVPVSMGGVDVHPGDVVLGDDDGIIVATLEELEGWLPKAEEIVATESAVFRRVQGGQPLLEQPEFAALAGRLPPLEQR
jgi:4-hydroxy-4-methyl-2-oxoglutarate aldolase|uniref:Dimethylmenaquinone methyltransferase n=1 Tax=Haptolina ericina TaxID=156174 RepID=A0A7S3C4I8_9EUKA|mmetsp:Transcript_7439/g.16632  ORF Transcript_7439/g.16632 Transcript_7439/m.16632 type:complete len:221 (+) Transcript_7439:25-687(+)